MLQGGCCTPRLNTPLITSFEDGISWQERKLQEGTMKNVQVEAFFGVISGSIYHAMRTQYKMMGKWFL